ncbi:MAG: type II toxin-antitoxin system RelE/ParE family toxin [Myxococcota bacterium]
MKIRWTAEAERDITAVLAFVADARPRAAKKLLTDIDRALARVALFPDSGRPVPEMEPSGDRPQREVVVAPFRIGYAVAGGEIAVLYVIHGARAFPPVRRREPR